ncbi:hypothetical protein KQI84_03470 [bacterium]|nr:hypothetical protein [bacterium]
MSASIVFMGINIGSPLYLAIVWGLSAVLVAIGCLIFRKNIRVKGFMSWIVLLALAGVGGLVTMPLIDLMNIGIWYAIPYFAISTIISIPWIHFGITKIAPDLNIDVFAASLMLGLLVGIAVVVAGYSAGEVLELGPIDLFNWGGIPQD